MLILTLALIVLLSSIMLWHQFSTDALTSSDIADDDPRDAEPDIAKAA